MTPIAISNHSIAALQAQEWSVLQNQCEQHERNALLIKLAAVVLTMIGLMLAQAPLALVLVAILWGQEAIIRTVQTRLAERLLQLEAALRDGHDWPPCQLHSNWQAQRGGSVTLVAEYARHALKPTVLYPYAVLAMLALISPIILIR